jgi:hypothetical protein
MAIGALTVGMLAVFGYMAFRAARRTGRTIGLLAWRVAQGSAVVFALAVLVYEKPKSFYTNFVIFPSLALFLTGLAGTIATLILGVTALFKRDDAKIALIAISISLLAGAIALGLIVWRAS